MTEMSRPATKLFLAAMAALALALTGTACSGEGGPPGSEPGAEASAAGPEARAITPAGAAEGDDASPARLATAEFDVEGMTCGGCALATEMAVKKLDGVESADAEYDEATGQGRCTVEYDPSAVGTDQIAAAIEKAGFTPTLKSTDESG